MDVECKLLNTCYGYKLGYNCNRIATSSPVHLLYRHIYAALGSADINDLAADHGLRFLGAIIYNIYLSCSAKTK